MDIQKILKPLRIDHWVKNLVILFGFIVALLYAPTHNIDYNNLILAFFILCISASSNYLINEYATFKGINNMLNTSYIKLAYCKPDPLLNHFFKNISGIDFWYLNDKKNDK